MTVPHLSSTRHTYPPLLWLGPVLPAHNLGQNTRALLCSIPHSNLGEHPFPRASVNKAKGGRVPRRDPPLKRYPVSYRTILRARRPPATSSTPVPSAIALGTETPPVLGSAEAEPPPPPEAVEVAVEEAGSTEAVLTLMSRPAATLSKQASTWFWLTPNSWATALKSSASAFWYSPSAAWIWSQSTYWTLPATAVWAKAGAAAASTIASIAANNITFLNLIPSSFRIPLQENILSSICYSVNTTHHIFWLSLTLLKIT